MPRALVAISAAAGSLMVACDSVRPSPARGDWVFAIAHARTVDADFARGGRRLLAGFPASIDEESFRAGDALLFGFESFRDEEVARFYIEMRCEADPDVEPRELELVTRDARRTVATLDRTVLVRVYDETLELVDEQRSRVPTAVHEAGLYGWARAEAGRAHDALPLWHTSRSLPPEGLREQEFAWPVAAELLAGMSGNRALCDRLRTLSIWPDLFQQIGILFGGAVFECHTRWARLVPQPIPELPGEVCYEIELMLRQGSTPLLAGHAVVVPPMGPLAISAGIVTLAGYRGEDPRQRFVARLLAMRQAPSPDPPREPASPAGDHGSSARNTGRKPTNAKPWSASQ